MLLFEEGNFVEHNMNRAQVSREDIMQEVRKSALSEDLNAVEKIFIERNGEITTVKK